MSTVKQRMTAKELLKIPADGYRYELIQGELQKMSPAGYNHGEVAGNLTVSLGSFIKQQQLGKICVAETGFKLTSEPDTVLAPDFAFIRKERVAQVATSSGFGCGAPDLVVEVTSPSDSYQAVENKVGLWLEAGVSMVLIINPRKKTVSVYRSPKNVAILSEEDEMEGQDVVPGWKMKVSELFL